MSDKPTDLDPILLRAALDSMGEGLLLIGLDERIKLANAHVETLLGIKARDVLGRRCAEALRGGLCEIDAAQVGGPARYHEEFDFIMEDGARLRVHRTVRPALDQQGNRVGTVVTFHLPQGRPGCTSPDSIANPSGQGRQEDSLHQLVGRSAVIRKIVDTVRRVALSDATVLVTGESGTGKELVARSIHENSRRRARPLVAVNCAAIPHDLLESELFGHVRGAFTGAIRDRRGLVEEAEGGTLFLDEIGELALPVQAKLLRLLQEKSYQRVGDSRPQPTNARIVAATNVDLERAITKGTFRPDLFFRISVIPIRIPPLRDRREDIAPLATHLLARRSVAAGRLPMRFSREAMRLLEEARWEGNVRQLINVVDYVIALCESSVVDARSLPEDFLGVLPDSETSRRARYQRADRGEAEAAEIREALEQHGFHRQRTADALGMDRVTLYRKIREHGIVIPDASSDEPA
jgi:two-component system, NtrC family, response regulator HydG